MPFIPRIRILDSVTNTYANLEMKDYVKYLGLMIDSNPSWKYHIESICHKISKSIGIIAKIRHYVSRRVLLSVNNSLIVPYLAYGICGWGNCALTFQRKIVTLQKRALRLIYFSKSKKHTVPFFLKSNCLPLPSLFFRDCSYLLYVLEGGNPIARHHGKGLERATSCHGVELSYCLVTVRALTETWYQDCEQTLIILLLSI